MHNILTNSRRQTGRPKRKWTKMAGQIGSDRPDWRTIIENKHSERTVEKRLRKISTPSHHLVEKD